GLRSTQNQLTPPKWRRENPSANRGSAEGFRRGLRSHKPRVGGSGRKEGRRGHRDFTSPFIGQSKEPPVRVFPGTLLDYWIVVLVAVLEPESDVVGDPTPDGPEQSPLGKRAPHVGRPRVVERDVRPDPEHLRHVA